MCTLATSTLPFSAQICVLWPLQPYLSVHKYVYFGHCSLTFCAQVFVLWLLQPYFSVHKYVYVDHFSLTFQCANTGCGKLTSFFIRIYSYKKGSLLAAPCSLCTLAISTLPFSAQICVLRPLQPYHSVHKYVYFATSTVPFCAQIRVLRPLKVNAVLPTIAAKYWVCRLLFSALSGVLCCCGCVLFEEMVATETLSIAGM
jgi:hypothetical protein